MFDRALFKCSLKALHVKNSFCIKLDNKYYCIYLNYRSGVNMCFSWHWFFCYLVLCFSISIYCIVYIYIYIHIRVCGYIRLNLFIEHSGEHWWEQNSFCTFTTPQTFQQSSAPGALTTLMTSVVRATLMSPGKDSYIGYIYIYICIYICMYVCIYIYLFMNKNLKLTIQEMSDRFGINKKPS